MHSDQKASSYRLNSLYNGHLTAKGKICHKIMRVSNHCEYNKLLEEYVEGFFSRLKQVFGFNFKSKPEINRGKALLIKCYLINKFIKIGMTVFEIAA